MINKMASFITHYFIKKEIITRNEYDIYLYGFELLISTIINGMSIIMISLFMGCFFGGILFMIAFIPLRITTGGYHAKNHFLCFLTINITFGILLLCIRLVSIDNAIPVSLFIVLFSSLSIWGFAPVGNKNKPLSYTQVNYLKTKSLYFATINMLLLIFLFIFPNALFLLLIYYYSGVFAASASLIVAYIKNKLH